MQPHAALLGPAAGCFLLLLLMSCAVAQPGQQGRTNGIQFNLKNFGGARAAVGAGKMRSIREKAGLQHKSLEELFQELDNDDDLVRCSCLLGSFVGCRMHAKRGKVLLHSSWSPPQASPTLGPDTPWGVGRNMQSPVASACSCITNITKILLSAVQGVDLEEEVLVYSCKPRSEGREEGPPVVTAEAEAAAAPLVGPEPLSGASTDLPGHHPHHHHRRQLLQQADATPEWNSTWTVSWQSGGVLGGVGVHQKNFNWGGASP